MKKLFLLFIFLFSLLQSGEISFSYKQALTNEDNQNLQLLKNSKRIVELETLLNDVFILKDNIKVVFGEEDGPYFDPDKGLIAIPYFFVEETKQKFQKVNYAKTQEISIDTATIDVMVHTIIHEFGHALISMYDISILGREEDAVDNLANIFLIDFLENGDDILLTNADIFDLYGDEKKVLEEMDFMDEHSLDFQRFYSLLCFVYASNPQKYEKMLNEYKFPMYKKDMCVNDLDKISRSWYQVLKPYMRN